MGLLIKGKVLLFLVVIFINPPVTQAAGNSGNAIIHSLEAIGRLGLFGACQISIDTVKPKPDLFYECKLADLGKKSPIDFDYNHYVRRYIDIYTIERREQVSRMLGLAEMYFPIFDEIFSRYHIPLELKYLACVESALNPLAVSRTGAVGLWQFKMGTAQMFNLRVDNFVDERMDPEKSTEAAAQYLEYLFRMFNDWHLALAAYNVGPGPIRNAIERANNEKNFWKLYPYLPESAQNYVPAFIAAVYAMNNYREHGIYPTPISITYQKTDTIWVRQPVDLKLLSEAININLETLRFLNPTYRYDYIPESKQGLALRLPTDKTGLFLRKSAEIYCKTCKPKTPPVAVSDSTLVKYVYTVRSGDSLHRLAMLLGCTLVDIYRWNPDIDSTNLAIGQNLILWVNPNKMQNMKQ